MPDDTDQLLRAYFDAWETGDPDVVAACFADGFTTTYTTPTGETVTVTPADRHDWIAGWLDAISEMEHEIHELVADGDRAMARVTYSGVHTGEIMGVEPTGERLEIREFVSVRFENGELVELHWLGDNAGLMRQLGLELPVQE